MPISRQTLTKALLMTLNVTESICSNAGQIIAIVILDSEPHVTPLQTSPLLTVLPVPVCRLPKDLLPSPSAADL